MLAITRKIIGSATKFFGRRTPSQAFINLPVCAASGDHLRTVRRASRADIPASPHAFRTGARSVGPNMELGTYTIS